MQFIGKNRKQLELPLIHNFSNRTIFLPKEIWHQKTARSSRGVPPGVFCKNCVVKFCEIDIKTPVMEFLTKLQTCACNFIKKEAPAQVFL